MALCNDVGGKLKEWKKLMFLLIIAYMALMVVLYQGHFTLRGFFTTPTSSLQVLTAEGSIQSSIRYIIQGNNSSENNQEAFLDIHLEHAVLGHTGEVIGSNHGPHTRNNQLVTIAIGGGITSKNIKGLTDANIPKKFPLFTTLLPSFCTTASKNFDYHFYFAYDVNDAFFINRKHLEAFQSHFHAYGAEFCKSLTAPLHIHFVQCSHKASPAWAQNDAMIEAYIDGIEFFYRINDDSRIKTSGWTEAFVSTLSKYDPKYVGVVGPKHSGGNTVILTYDFVHRTHINIFGFYYPRLFTTWWADDWVTKVYQPGRSTKRADMLLQHTMLLGQRYKVDYAVSKKVNKRIEDDKKTLQRYIKARTSKDQPVADGSRVISFSLYGRDPEDTMGALRNAQLLPVYYPGWNMRVYVPNPNTTATADLHVPQRIINCLLLLGVQVAYVNISNSSIKPKFWSYLIADDEQVDIFLIRNVRSRASDREAEAVRDWLTTGVTFHCMRDHPSFNKSVIVEDLWGARGTAFRKLLQSNVATLLKSGTEGLLEKVIYPAVQQAMYCHDSTICDSMKSSSIRDFPSPRAGTDYVGDKYNRYEEHVDNSRQSVKNFQKVCPKAIEPVEKSPIKNSSDKVVDTAVENVLNMSSAANSTKLAANQKSENATQVPATQAPAKPSAVVKSENAMISSGNSSGVQAILPVSVNNTDNLVQPPVSPVNQTKLTKR